MKKKIGVLCYWIVTSLPMYNKHIFPYTNVSFSFHTILGHRYSGRLPVFDICYERQWNHSCLQSMTYVRVVSTGLPSRMRTAQRGTSRVTKTAWEHHKRGSLTQKSFPREETHTGLPSARYCCPARTKTAKWRQICVKLFNIIFNKNPFTSSVSVTWGRTDEETRIKGQ